MALVAERSEAFNPGSILMMCVRTYVRVCHARECCGDVTQECRCVMLAGLGIRRILLVKGHIIAWKEGGAWERTPQAGPFSHGGGGHCRAFSEA